MKHLVAAGGLVVLTSLLACTLKTDPPTSSRAGDTAKSENSPMSSESVTWGAVEQESELGRVRFARDYDAARARARREQKPLFVLFDEVPG